MKPSALVLGVILIALLLAVTVYFSFPLTGELISYRNGRTIIDPFQVTEERIILTDIKSIFEDPGKFVTKEVTVKGVLQIIQDDFYIRDSKENSIKIESPDISPFLRGQVYHIKGILAADRYCSCFYEVPVYRRVSGGNMVVEECHNVLEGICGPPYYTGTDGESYCDCLLKKEIDSYRDVIGTIRISECREFEGRCDYPTIGWGEPLIIVTDITPA